MNVKHSKHVFAGLVAMLMGIAVCRAGSVEAPVNKGGYIKNWLLCGALPNNLSDNEERGGFEFDFLQQAGGEGQVVPRVGMRVSIPQTTDANQSFKWFQYTAPAGLINLKHPFPDSDNTVVYAYCNVLSDQDFDGMIGAGSDDGIKIWLNGQLLHRNPAKRGVGKNDDTVPAHFLKGINRLLVKIDNLTGGFGFCLFAATTPELVKHIKPDEKRLQPESRFFNKSIMIDNQRYRWLTTSRPGQMPTRSGKVKQGIMTQVGNRYSYAKYAQMKAFANLDFLEIRCYLAKMYDTEGKLVHTELIDKALQKAKEAGIKRVELSLLLEKGISDYYQKRFKDQPIALMAADDSSPAGSLASDQFSKQNSQFFSYWDKQNRHFMMTMVADLVRYYQDAPLKDMIFEWHFRFPTYNDWGYPRCSGFYDYSPAATEAFRNYLKTQKRFTLNELSKRYNKPIASWQEVKPPQPVFDQLNLSLAWQDFQDFRVWTLVQNQTDICKTIRRYDPTREIVAWFTTSLKNAGRDGIQMDADLKLSKTYPKLLVSHTSVDFFNLEGELFGSLAQQNNIPINIEPVHCTMNSYLRTFYNCMRFPVKQINWLFWIDFSPETRPWISWVMERGDILDELYDAQQVTSPVSVMYSYSDRHCAIPGTLWDTVPDHNRKVSWFRALAAGGYNLPWLTDFSTRLNWTKQKAIICGDNRVLRPEVIAALKAYCQNGGKVVIVGETGAYNMETGKKDWPLLTALGVKPDMVVEQKTECSVTSTGVVLPQKSSWKSKNGIALKQLPGESAAAVAAVNDNGLIKAAHWQVGKGDVLFFGDDYQKLIKDNGAPVPELNDVATAILKWAGSYRPAIASPNGLCHFLKKKENTLYLGVINANDELLDGTVKLLTVDPRQTYRIEEMLFNKTPAQQISGKELMTSGLNVKMDFQWELKLFKITPAK